MHFSFPYSSHLARLSTDLIQRTPHHVAQLLFHSADDAMPTSYIGVTWARGHVRKGAQREESVTRLANEVKNAPPGNVLGP